LQIDIGLAACDESRGRPLALRQGPADGGKVSRVEPTPAGFDQQEAEARRVAAVAAWGFAQMFPSIQRGVDLICRRRQGGIAWIAEAGSSTHIR
jgi:hypothetical protein